MKITNNYNLPEAIVLALTKDNYSRGASNRSVTQLIDSPRVQILQREFDAELYEDATDRMWSILGTAVHNIFEDATPEHDNAEERIFYEANGWVISGAIDLQEQSDNYSGGVCTVMSDYKCTSVWSVIYGKKEWNNQLNAYGWLSRHGKGVDVDRLRVVAVLRDWNRREAKMKPDYPNAPIVIVDIPRWTNEEQDRYMEERIRLHSEAEFNRLTGDPLPHCLESERWMQEATYAIMKGKNKRATRVLKTKEEADDFIKVKELDDSHTVVERKGKASRCEGDYCHVARFCSQYQSEVRGGEEPTIDEKSQGLMI